MNLINERVLVILVDHTRSFSSLGINLELIELVYMGVNSYERVSCRN